MPCTFAVMTVFSSGISMYALGLLFQLVLGWSFTASVLLSAAIVLVYTFLGGLTSAIYNEVLQFFLIVLGFAPLAIMAVLKAGGWSGMSAAASAGDDARLAYMNEPSQNPMGVEVFGLVAGLGFVLSFGYWCTDFLVVQRAMAADSMSAARRTPLIAAFPKMIMPFIVIVPGIAALALSQDGAGLCAPAQAGWRTRLRSGADHADGAVLSVRHAGPGAHRADGFLHVGHGRQRDGLQHRLDLRPLSRLHPQARAGFALSVGGPHHTVVGVALSIGTAYLASHFNNIMDFLQLVFGFVNAPLFATFLLGMFWKRATGHGAFTGLLAGTLRPRPRTV